MKAAIYDPYLDTLGGGERYVASFAKVLLDLGWKVEIEWRDPEIKNDIAKRFGIDLKDAEIVKDIKRGDGCDVCFWVSDGSIPVLHARRNFLHFQVPFHHIGGNNLLNKMKLIRVDKIICNSEFTKKFIDHEYGVESIVVYPPVDINKIKPKRKENIILGVARFSDLLQSKGQDVLIKVFKKMVEGGLTDWKLVLAGGTEIGAGDYIEKLEGMAKGYPIEIIKSPDFGTLRDLYGKSKIFWSAAGFGEDEEKYPEKVEHFGITVVEAMAAGTVPIAFSAGGHKEIIKDGVSGFLWHNTHELVEKTNKALASRTEFAKNAVRASESYSYDEFRKNISEIL